MQGSNGKKVSDKIETIIGKGTVVEGSISVASSVLINGTLDGPLTTTGTVRVGTDGIVRGDVTARKAFVGGRIEGKLTAEEIVILGPESHLLGDLVTAQLTIEEGAVFDGQCVMLPPGGVGAENKKTPIENEESASAPEHRDHERKLREGRSVVGRKKGVKTPPQLGGETPPTIR